MRGLCILLVLALLVIAIDTDNLRFPVQVQGNFESNSTRIPSYSSSRTAYVRSYQTYQYSRYRSPRSWEPAPFAGYIAFRARLNEGSTLLELSAENVKSGIQDRDWDQIMRGKDNAARAKRAFSDALELLPAQ